MSETETLTIRLYEHDETRARVEGKRAEVEAHGWDYQAGALIRVRGRLHEIVSVGSRLQTDDVRGNYVTAEATDVFVCSHCKTDITSGARGGGPDAGGSCPTCKGHLCRRCAGGWCS